jgi:hypothetical protein
VVSRRPVVEELTRRWSSSERSERSDETRLETTTAA